MKKLADNISRKKGIFPAPGQQRHRSTCLDSPSPSLQSVSTALKRDTWHHNAHSKSKEGHPCPQLPLQKKSLTKSLYKDSTEKVSNIFEYVNCKAEVKDNVLNVKGRLRKHIDFWINVLKARENVCNIIFSGYIVPFYELPESKYCKNNKSAIAHSDFVSKSIQELLQNGIVVKVDQIPHVVNPLTVSVNAKGKEKLILDLRQYVNQYVVKYKFKLEGIKEALDFVHRNGFMFKFGLSSGYHHIDLHASMYKYFGFSWDNCFYVFSSLPFGLSSAPFIFTKIL